MAGFANLLPLHVIAGLLGIAFSDACRMRTHFVAALQAMDSAMNPSPELLSLKFDHVAAVEAFILQQVEHQDGVAGEGLLAFLLDECRAGRCSKEEVVHMLAFLLFSGHETTISMVGNGLWLLLCHPEQWSRLKADPARLAPGAVEEILRMESPLQRTTFRMAVTPLEIDGFAVEAGYQLALAVGAANRDPAVFANPDDFDIERQPNRHLAFGLGAHNCLGKHLARLEGRIAFARLAERLPDLRLAGAAPNWRDNSLFRGLVDLPVSF